MSDSRIPEPPLPRPFLRVIEADRTTREDVERLRRQMQQTIDNLQAELSKEREIARKFEKSGSVLQDILTAPDFRALSMKTQQTQTESAAPVAHGAYIDEPPVEYVPVTEIELTESIVTEKDLQNLGQK